MIRKMKWAALDGNDGEKILFVTTATGEFMPYYRSSHAVPDYNIPGGSKGYATMQKLLREGWEFIPSEEVTE